MPPSGHPRMPVITSASYIDHVRHPIIGTGPDHNNQQSGGTARSMSVFTNGGSRRRRSLLLSRADRRVVVCLHDETHGIGLGMLP